MQRPTTKLVSLLFFILFLFANQQVSGQNTEERSLASILKELEEQWDIRFSYVPSEIENVTLPTLPDDISLEQALIALAARTEFEYVAISDRYISVSRKLIPDKTLCGRVLDTQTGLPLEGTSIVVGADVFGTSTNRDGVFSIPSQFSNERIEIQFLGYTTLTLNASELSPQCENLLLSPSYSELNEVLLRHFLVQGLDRNIDGSTTINTNNFGLLPGQIENDVLQMAQVLPGVESVNETISTINTRGGSNDENLILWEGNRMYQTGHFFGLISAFNPNLTQRVSIYKNGTPANYGESVSGVIDISSSDSIPSRFNGGAGINLIHANVFVEMPITENFGLQISGRGSSNDLFNTPIYNTYAQRIFQDSKITNIMNTQQSTEVDASEDFSFYDLGLKSIWTPSEKDKIRLNFLTINNDLDFTETLVDLSQSKTSKLEQRSLVGGISWDRKWSSNFMSKAKLYSSYYLLEALNINIFTNQELIQENEVLELGGQLDTQLLISDRLQLHSGYHFSEIGIANTQDVNLPRFRDFEKDVVRTHIVHAGLHWESADGNTALNAGARFNYFDKFNESLIEPRLQASQKLGAGFTLEAAGEFKSQTTTQRIDFESDFLGVEKRRWVLANNQDIPIKKGKQGSLGLVFDKANWFINVEGFYKRVEGITSKSQGFQNQFQFLDATGDYDVMGLEFILNKKIRDFSGWVTYSYSENDYEFDTFTPSVFPNNIDIRHTAKLGASYQIKELKLATGLHWRSGKPFTKPVAGEAFIIGNNGLPRIQFGEPNIHRLPDFIRWDLSAEYFWDISPGLDARINLSLLNVLDKKNTLNIRYAIEVDGEDILVNRIEELSLGFSPNLSFQ
ncbi:MAG: carboxypeptidase-like regulatory domain-containing protein, partial [Bacteroidota bacterium]